MNAYRVKKGRYIQMKMDEMAVIISSKLYHEEMYSQLIEYQVPDELIINAGKIIVEANKMQYFDLPELLNGR